MILSDIIANEIKYYATIKNKKFYKIKSAIRKFKTKRKLKNIIDSMNPDIFLLEYINLYNINKHLLSFNHNIKCGILDKIDHKTFVLSYNIPYLYKIKCVIEYKDYDMHTVIDINSTNKNYNSIYIHSGGGRYTLKIHEDEKQIYETFIKDIKNELFKIYDNVLIKAIS